MNDQIMTWSDITTQLMEYVNIGEVQFVSPRVHSLFAELLHYFEENDGKDEEGCERNMGKVFLGGSCGDTTWRTDLIPHLEQNEIEYFNPVVEKWDDKTFKKEQEEKAYAATLLFVLSPRTANVYSIAEMVNLIRDERRVIVVFLENDGDKTIEPFSKIAFSNIQKDMEKFKNAIFASFKSFNDDAIEFIINQINQ